MMKKLITIALLAFICQTASAQFGNLLNKHQELQIVGSGTVMYIYIIGGGWDTSATHTTGTTSAASSATD